MMDTQQDIFSQTWLDVVFEGRNKQYGAYLLRRDHGKNTTIGLLIASTVFILSLAGPMIYSRVFSKSHNGQELYKPLDNDDRVVELDSPPPVDLETPLPSAVEPPRPRTDQVRMPEPVVVHAAMVSEEMPTIKALEIANPGAETIAGSDDAPIRIDMPVGEGRHDAEVTERGADTHEVFVTVEVEPEFPGGMKAFMKYVQQNYHYPEAALESGVNGQVILQFVVERDGSLTDIKVLRDLKFGTGDEAVRLLKNAPRWRPGIQNGRPVRVAYTLPIGLSIGK